MKNVLLGALLVLAATSTHAGTSQDLESSAVVDGSIVLAMDGSVQSATVTDAPNFGAPIADMVRNAALQWHFQPVLRDGQPVLAKASMHVRVVLKPTPDGNFSARIKGATFGDEDARSTDELSSTDASKKILPRYPDVAIHYRVQGTVYLALHVDRSGHVTDAVAEQVNLRNIGPEHLLKQYRDIMAKSALKVARQWTYTVPTTGKLAGQDSWTARMPVNYTLNEMDRPKTDSVWQTYVPGPYTPAPWVDKPDMNAADALADDDGDHVQTDGAGPVLLSPAHRG